MMENISFNKLNVIKRMHAILNGLKLLQCFVCHRQTPGFDSHFHNLTVLESGKKVLFVTKDIEKQLRQSKVLGVSVNLSFSFAEANQCFTEGKFSMGICVDCSKYYTINENNDLLPKADYGEYRRKQMLVVDERDASELINDQDVM